MKLRLSWYWMVPIIFLSLMLISGRLTYDTLWYDEITTMLFIGGGKFDPITPDTMLFRVAVDYAWPPGYFILAYLWEFLMQGSALGHRLLSVWFGMLSIAAMYRLGRSMFGTQRAGIIAALLVASCASLLHQFHEARGYTLWLFVGILQLWVYWLALQPKIFERSKSVRWGFALTTGILLYLHYVSVVSIFILGLYHLIFERKNPNYVPIIKLAINGSLLFGLWLTVLLIGFYNKTLGVIGELGATYWSSLFAFSNGMPLLLAIIGGYSLTRLRTQRTTRLILFYLIGIYIMVGIGNQFADFVHHPRHILIVLLPIALLVTDVLEDWIDRSPLLGISILALWVTFGALNTGNISYTEGMQGQFELVPDEVMESSITVAESCIATDDKVLLNFWSDVPSTWPHNTTMFYHFRTYGFEFSQLERMENITNYGVDQLDTIPYEERTRSFIQGAERVWFFSTTDLYFQKLEDEFEDIIADMGYMEREVIIGTPIMKAYVYHRADDPIQEAQACVENALAADHSRTRGR